MEMKFTLEELEQEARKFLRETFDMGLHIPIVISARMKNSFGLFRHYRNTREPIDIRISKNLLINYSREQILGTLKHECVHYALYMMGKPFKDGDFWFEHVLSLYGVPTSGTKRYKGPAHRYACSGCEREFIYKTKGQEKRYISGCCEARIDYIGETVIGMAADSGE